MFVCVCLFLTVWCVCEACVLKLQRHGCSAVIDIFVNVLECSRKYAYVSVFTFLSVSLSVCVYLPVCVSVCLW